MNRKLTLKNPHSIAAALRERPHQVVSLHVSSNSSGPWDEAARLAARHGVPCARPAKGESSSAVVIGREDVSVEELFSPPGAVGDDRGVWVALDTVQDPHNVGAVFRSAAFFGVRGILFQKDRTAPLNDAAYDVASGGVEYVPHARVTNLGRALVAAREVGLWVLGTSERAERDLADVPLDRPYIVVIGNEERGMRLKVEEKCDLTCRIVPLGEVCSLNAAVAAGILISALTSRSTSP